MIRVETFAVCSLVLRIAIISGAVCRQNLIAWAMKS